MRSKRRTGYRPADLGRVRPYTQSKRWHAAVGKSRSHVANTLRLLKLPVPVRDMVVRGELSAGHARALLAVRNPAGVAVRIVEQGLNVRDVERIAQNEARAAEPDGGKPKRVVKERDADTRALETAMEDVLGLVVRVDHRGSAGGELRIRYRSVEQLESLCKRLRAAVG